MDRLRKDSYWRDVWKTALVNTLIGLGLVTIQFIFGGLPRTPWRWIAANQIYAHSIGSLASFLMPRVAIWVQPLPPVRRWIVYITTLVVGAVLGSLIGTVGVVLAGFASWTALAPRLIGSSLIAVIITLVIGIGAYLFESLKGRFEETTLELREKQLQNERAMKLAAEAQFSSLQSRLQPHFLFNTINSVLSLIRDDPAAAETMLQRLSRLLRFALDSHQRSSVTLREELRLVADYLEIEQTRFGSRLRYELALDPALEEMEIPPFSIQTLVENSMKYAVATRREGGRIAVRVEREGARILVEVADDGPGFDAQAITAGHGLDTLIRRLEALHGEGGRLEILPGAGGRVRLFVPATASVS